MSHLVSRRAFGAGAAPVPGVPLPRAFFARDAVTVARALIGASLVHRVPGEAHARVVRIVETEAYVGEHDRACHARHGRTERTAPLYGPPGHAYVYLVYGLHELFNVVTGVSGRPEAVLLRAGEPVAGIAGRTDGPGRLARAMGISRAANAFDVCAGPLRFEAGPPCPIAEGPRVGVDFAGAWAHAPLRFVDPESAHLSRRGR